MGAFDIDPDTAPALLHVPGDWRRPSARESYTLHWDQARAFGQLWPRPAPEEVMSFYDVEDYYTHGAAPAAPGRRVAVPQRLLTKISWLADRSVDPDARWWAETLGPQPCRILEIGCGSGTNLTILRDLGHTVTGIEPDPAALDVARSRGFEVHRGTAETLPDALAGQKFDAVVFMHVMEHCIDPARALENAVALLDGKGSVVAEVPNNACAGATRFGNAWYWLDVPRHVNFFTSESLQDLFRFAGLDVGGIFFRGYCRQFSPEWKAQQARIHSTFAPRSGPGIPSLAYWAYLLRTAIAAPARKYDSVRVVGRLR